jgi:hypothetical protein
MLTESLTLIFLPGRTYAMDCYLKLLVRLCHIYSTVGGVKKAKDGASPEQIVAEKRLQALQRGLVKNLSEVSALSEVYSFQSLPSWKRGLEAWGLCAYRGNRGCSVLSVLPLFYLAFHHSLGRVAAV